MQAQTTPQAPRSSSPQWLSHSDWTGAFPNIQHWQTYSSALPTELIATLCAAQLGQAPAQVVVEQPWQAQWLTQRCKDYFKSQAIVAAPMPQIMTLGQWRAAALKQRGFDTSNLTSERQAALSLSAALKNLNIDSIASDAARYALAVDMVALLKEIDTRARLSPMLPFAGQDAGQRLSQTTWLSREASWLAVAREHLQQGGKPLDWQTHLQANTWLIESPQLLAVLPAPHPSLGMQAFMSDIPNVSVCTVCLPLLASEADQAARVSAIQVQVCDSFEQEAIAGAHWVQTLMAQTASKQSVVVVAHDRVLARRVAALLARNAVAVEDRVGWALSTTVSATVLRGLLSSWQSSDVPALLAWLALPAVAASWPHAQPCLTYLRTVWNQQAIVPEGREFMRRAIAHAPNIEVKNTLHQWRVAQQSFARADTISRHAHALAAYCQPLAATLKQDAAGEKVWQHLQTLALETEATLVSLATFIAVLDETLESERFSASTHSYSEPSAARAIFAPLYEAAWTQNLPVLMLGCNEAHFPAAPRSPTPLLNSVRRELGLSLPSTEPAVWQHLLAQNDQMIVATYTPSEQGNPSRLSPYLLGADQSVSMISEATDRPVFDAVTLNADAIQARHDTELLTHAAIDVPALPSEISVTKLAAVLQCPYRFALQTVFNVQPLTQPALWPSQSDRGNLLHAALHQVKDDLQSLESSSDGLAKAIHAALHALMQDKISLSGRYAALAADSQRTLATYVSAHTTRQQEGWRLQGAEVAVESHQLLANVRVHGKIDRLDVIRDITGQAQGYAVLDYKTSSEAVLKAKRDAPLLDAQLTLYAALIEHMDMPAAQAAYWRLHDGLYIAGGQRSATPEDAVYHSKKTVFELASLPTDIDQVTDGVRLAWQNMGNDRMATATPSQEACEYCHYKGICRSSERPLEDFEEGAHE